MIKRKHKNSFILGSKGKEHTASSRKYKCSTKRGATVLNQNSITVALHYYQLIVTRVQISISISKGSPLHNTWLFGTILPDIYNLEKTTDNPFKSMPATRRENAAQHCHEAYA